MHEYQFTFTPRSILVPISFNVPIGAKKTGLKEAFGMKKYYVLRDLNLPSTNCTVPIDAKN
jgi:hypothetical protein